MALDRQQHVGEAAEHMRRGSPRARSAPAIGARHLVGGDAEMVRPEPDQPLDEADLGRERGVDARLGLVEVELLRRDADGRPLPRRPACRRRSLAVRFSAARSCCPPASRRIWRRASLELERRARRRTPLLSRSALAMRPAPLRSSSAISAPRGSDAIAAIEPARGPSPKRCSASAACAFGSSAMCHRLMSPTDRTHRTRAKGCASVMSRLRRWQLKYRISS